MKGIGGYRDNSLAEHEGLTNYTSIKLGENVAIIEGGSIKSNGLETFIGGDDTTTSNYNQVTVEDKEVKEENTLLVNPPTEERESDYWYYVKIPFKEVDFTSLLEKNKDTVAYIHMDHTNINYPVVSSGDNEFYLNHDFNKRSNKEGWIFLEYRNNYNNLSDNTVIYGHGRINNTLFDSLNKHLQVLGKKKIIM